MIRPAEPLSVQAEPMPCPVCGEELGGQLPLCLACGADLSEYLAPAIPLQRGPVARVVAALLLLIVLTAMGWMAYAAIVGDFSLMPNLTPPTATAPERV